MLKVKEMIRFYFSIVDLTIIILLNSSDTTKPQPVDYHNKILFIFNFSCELNEKYNNEIKINWDKKNGTPEIITFSRPVSFDRNQENSSQIFRKEIAKQIRLFQVSTWV